MQRETYEKGDKPKVSYDMKQVQYSTPAPPCSLEDAERSYDAYRNKKAKEQGATLKVLCGEETVCTQFAKDNGFRYILWAVNRIVASNFARHETGIISIAAQDGALMLFNLGLFPPQDFYPSTISEIIALMETACTKHKNAEPPKMGPVSDLFKKFLLVLAEDPSCEWNAFVEKDAETRRKG